MSEVSGPGLVPDALGLRWYGFQSEAFSSNVLSQFHGIEFPIVLDSGIAFAVLTQMLWLLLCF